MMLKSAFFHVLVFTAIDLIAFFLIYFSFSWASSGFWLVDALDDALVDGGLAVLARLLYLQVFVQVVSLVMLQPFSFASHWAVAMAVAAALMSYALIMMFFVPDPTGLLDSFAFDVSSRALGPSLALLASSLIAALVVQRWLPR